MGVILTVYGYWPDNTPSNTRYSFDEGGPFTLTQSQVEILLYSTATYEVTTTLLEWPTKISENQTALGHSTGPWSIGTQSPRGGPVNVSISNVLTPPSTITRTPQHTRIVYVTYTMAGTKTRWTVDVIAGTDPRDVAEPPPPPPPAPPPSIDFDVYTPDGVLIANLTNLIEKRIRVELNGEGAGHFIIHRANDDATEAILQKGNIVRVTYTEIDPDPIWEFVIEEGDFSLISSDEDGGEELRFGGPGTLSVLRNGIIHPIPIAVGWTTAPWERVAGSVKWLDQEAGNIIRRMIEEAEARGVLGPGSYDITRTFTNVDDSNGTPWAPMGSWLAPMGANLYDEVMRLVAAGQLHIEMAVGLVLNAYQTIGVDRTSATFAADKVRFAKGSNIADELGKGLPGGDFASHAIIQGSSGAFRYRNVSTYPFVREVFTNVSSDDTSVLDTAGDALLGAHEYTQESIIFAHRVPWPGDGPDDDQGIYLPGPVGSANGRYWVGDLVTLHTGAEEFDYTDATHRVYAITIYEDETGYVAPPIVELNAPFAAQAGMLSSIPTATSGASGGGSSGGSGGGTPGPHTHTIGSAVDVNVVADPPEDGEVLAWDDTAGQWVPAALDFVTTNEGGGEDINTVASSGTTETLDLATGNVHDVTLTDDCTFTFDTPAAGRARSFTLFLRQGASPPHTVTWPGTVVWAAGLAPTLAAALDAVNVLTFVTLDGGIVWYGFETGGSGGGMTNPMTTAGDIIKGGTAGAAERLAIGSNGQVLTVSSGAPAWAASSGGDPGGSAEVASRVYAYTTFR